MAKTIIGYFADNGQARWALQELKNKGYREISVLGNQRGQEPGNRNISQFSASPPGPNMPETAPGSLAALALGVGSMVIPGIGPILALGPLTAAIGGAVSGSITDALTDYGIPEDKSLFFEAKVREGNTVMVVLAADHLAGEAARVMNNFGAGDVTIY